MVRAIAIALCLLAAWPGPPPMAAAEAAPKPALADPDPAPLRALVARLVPLHQAKPPPRPSEWLATQKEDGQTFAQYLDSDPNRITAKRNALYIQPLGAFDAGQQRLIADTAELLHRFYAVRVTVAGAQALDAAPETARRRNPHTGQEQLLTDWALDWLKRRRPGDAVAVLGLTTIDLWPGMGWNYVFGQASLGDRVGVWSVARYGDPAHEQALVLRRTLKVALHETGHMFGIEHCIAWQCLMNGSIDLPETDRSPLYCCPECEAKIWWACHADPAKRYAALVDFASNHGLDEEAAFWTRSLAAVAARP